MSLFRLFYCFEKIQTLQVPLFAVIPLKQAESILNRWEKLLNANSYEIQLSRPSIKASILYDSNISNANVTSAAQIEYRENSLPYSIDVL